MWRGDDGGGLDDEQALIPVALNNVEPKIYCYSDATLNCGRILSDEMVSGLG